MFLLLAECEVQTNRAMFLFHHCIYTLCGIKITEANLFIHIEHLNDKNNSELIDTFFEEYVSGVV